MQKETREVTRRRFTVHEYHRMAEVGILHEDDRIELIDGELVEMTAIGTRHFTCVNRLTHLLVGNVGDDVIVSVQNPVRLNEYSEPQPDVALIRARDYRESLPTPDDVLLLIEVSYGIRLNSNVLRVDRLRKPASANPRVPSELSASPFAVGRCNR